MILQFFRSDNSGTDKVLLETLSVVQLTPFETKPYQSDNWLHLCQFIVSRLTDSILPGAIAGKIFEDLVTQP